MKDAQTTNEDKKVKPPILDYELNHGELKDWEVRFYKRFGEGINYNAHPSVRVREFISDELAKQKHEFIDILLKMKISKKEIEDMDESSEWYEADMAEVENEVLDEVIEKLTNKENK